MANPKLPIDVLRTKCWLREVMLKINCRDVSKLSSIYIAECKQHEKLIPWGYQILDIRWGDYELGKNRPTQDTLEAVNSVFHVDADFYNHGPDDLLLWNALWYTNSLQDLNKLQAIVDTSEQLDGSIAKLRLDVFLKRESVHYFLENLYSSIGCGVSKLEFANNNMSNIVDELGRHLKSDASVNDVINYLFDDLLPYASSAYYAGIMESDRTYKPNYIETVTDEMIKEDKLADLRTDKPARSARST